MKNQQGSIGTPFNCYFISWDSDCIKGSTDPSHFIFEINVGKGRMRHRTTLKLNFWIDSKSIQDGVIFSRLEDFKLIRFFLTFVLEIEWLGSQLPLTNLWEIEIRHLFMVQVRFQVKGWLKVSKCSPRLWRNMWNKWPKVLRLKNLRSMMKRNSSNL